MLPLITPKTALADKVFAFTTTRIGDRNTGASQQPADAFNLAEHIGDDSTAVAQNRDVLSRALNHVTGQDVTLRWLNQTHSGIVVDDVSWSQGVHADGVITRRAGQGCLVMTADCLPVVLVADDSSHVAALHCGWKGLYQQLITKTLRAFSGTVRVWLGPAISQANYEVDTVFFERFMDASSDYRHAFIANRPGHYLCDLYELARVELGWHGVQDITGGAFCTFADPQFYSHRQHPRTGRQVTGVVILS